MPHKRSALVGTGTIAVVATFTFEQARQCVLERVAESRPSLLAEDVALLESAGRVLAESVAADRDYPPIARSVRDGFALRAADLPGELLVIGEVRAGEKFSGEVRAGEAVEIMTGAPLPQGADAVVMVEHVTLNGRSVNVPRTLRSGENLTSDPQFEFAIARRAGFTSRRMSAHFAGGAR
jgi:molybdopterin molybdotransferase